MSYRPTYYNIIKKYKILMLIRTNIAEDKLKYSNTFGIISDLRFVTDLIDIFTLGFFHNTVLKFH